MCENFEFVRKNMPLSIQEELWNIFSYYSLHGNPRDPSRINATQFYNFCRDCMVFDSSMTELAVTQAQVQLTFAAQVRNLKEASKNQTLATTGRLTYTEFLTCLVALARKCYPSADDTQASMQQLLMDNILPLASRRKAAKDCPVLREVKKFSADIQAIKDHYHAPLESLFHYFATDSKQDAAKFSTKAASPLKGGGGSPDKKRPGKQRQEITYTDFLKYCCSELGINAALGLTTIDFGDIYLTTVATENCKSPDGFSTTFQGLSFDDVWDALCRCAYHGFKNRAKVILPLKIKGMFNAIFRYMQQSKQNVPEDQSSNPKYRRRIRCLQLLNERFIAMWTKDGFKDYFDNAPATNGSTKSGIGAVMRGALVAPKAGDDDGDTGGDVDGREEDEASANLDVNVELAISDSQDFGDPRITPVSVIKLLTARPDLALLLKECMIDEQICDA